MAIPKNKIYLQKGRVMILFQIYTGYYYRDLRIRRKDQLMNDEEHRMSILSKRDKNCNDTINPLLKFPYTMENNEAICCRSEISGCKKF